MQYIKGQSSRKLMMEFQHLQKAASLSSRLLRSIEWQCDRWDYSRIHLPADRQTGWSCTDQSRFGHDAWATDDGWWPQRNSAGALHAHLVRDPLQSTDSQKVSATALSRQAEDGCCNCVHSEAAGAVESHGQTQQKLAADAQSRLTRSIVATGFSRW